MRAGQGTLAYTRDLLAWFRDHPARDLLPVVPPEVSDSPAIGHAFLLGFPRSGTTLLEQVLARHPLVVALEERETLHDSVLEFMRTPVDLARLGLATDADLVPFRRAYWKRVSDAGVVANRKVFVDKHPLNGLKLPLITRLFPEGTHPARDPRPARRRAELLPAPLPHERALLRAAVACRGRPRSTTRSWS